MTTKGKKSYFSWSSEFNSNNYTPINVINKLFDSLVKPILLYGSEIWGASCKYLLKGNFINYLLKSNMKYELFLSNICKHMLGVKKRASHLGCKAELGMFPINLTIMQRIIHYYIRVKEMDDKTLAKKALLHQNIIYLNECNTDGIIKRSFLHSVVSAVKFSGCNHFELNKKSNKISHSSKMNLSSNLKQNYSQLFFKYLNDNKDNINLRSYIKFKKNYKKELYVDAIVSPALSCNKIKNF